ncbi:TIGR04222 domain-containing membrane protein [Kitasatospora sp. DSM 101779]|uniref:TIGR04222 domain-containing membrane protein n=1 Tax=Kitasatospora sp. DSM 101779 TaxID=2853165 RepID=UPI0021D9FDCF|nr:TIGR04222 domain-containing membrane protein [Kitasatospora sp. DSM 101779]MCU7820439.1 TIGR04222 domain-containing membrane protein [Kitasatospora sp. DSM 101779]
MGTFWTVCSAAGVVVAALLRHWPARGRTDGLGAARLAALRGGPKAALVVVVVEFRLSGALDADRGGRLRLSGRVDLPADPTPAHRAVRSALSRPLALADVAARPAVQRARHDLRRDLSDRHLICGPTRLAGVRLISAAAAGAAGTAILQGSVVPGALLAAAALALLLAGPRTAAGRRELARLRRLHPLPTVSAATTRPVDRPGAAEETALLVAVHGRRALRVLLPVFSARTGLLGGRTARDTVSRSDGAHGFHHAWISGSDTGGGHGL